MVSKTLASVGLATALVASAGASVAAAQNNMADSTKAVVTTADQDRARVHDCDLRDGDPLQTRIRDQRRDPAAIDGDPAKVQERAHERVGAGSGGEGAHRHRDDANGPFGAGPGDGTGPIHDGPEDGTGSRFGRIGR